MNYNDALNFNNKTQLKQSAAQLNKANASTVVNGIKKFHVYIAQASINPNKTINQWLAQSR